MARGVAARKQPAMQGRIRSLNLGQTDEKDDSIIGKTTEGIGPVMKGKVGMQVKQKQSPIKRGDNTMNTLDGGRGKGR